MTEQEFLAWAKRKREPLEMAFAKSISTTIAKHSKRLTKFVGWWLTAVGASAGVLAANSEQARKMFGVRGFKADFTLLVIAGLLGLWSQYRGMQAQKALAVLTSMIKSLPPILEAHGKLAKELHEAEGQPDGYVVAFDIESAMQLSLSMQPWLAKKLAAYGRRKGKRSAHPELFPYSEAARLTFWQQISAQGMVLMTLLFTATSGYLAISWSEPLITHLSPLEMPFSPPDPAHPPPASAGTAPALLPSVSNSVKTYQRLPSSSRSRPAH